MLNLLALLTLSQGLLLDIPASKPQRHLYVADDRGDKIVEFPIGAGGLPSLKPDKIINLNGQAYGMAFDVAGNLYVSVATDTRQKAVVEEFQPGANGSERPERTIVFGPRVNPDWIAIDSKNNLYVDIDNYQIHVYAPANLREPIAVIRVPDLALGMVMDSSGALFVSELDQVGVYLQPLLRQKPDGLVRPQGGYEFAIMGSIAVDESDHN